MRGFDWLAWAAEECEQVRVAGRWRAPRPFDAAGPAGRLGEPDGAGPPRAPAAVREVVSFASNDYLGLTRHPAVIAAAHEALDRWGAGSGAARLVVGSRPVHHELEAALAGWKKAEQAVLFPTGFAANLGLLTVVAGAGVLVLSDELNHASIIDGCRAARAMVEVVPHVDLGVLATRLRAAPGPTVVVTDSVFSMDGDVVDLPALVELCAAHGALLVLDEAHAVLGPELDRSALSPGAAVAQVGTLSKTLGSLGGFVAGPRALCELVVNRARPYIFTTATTPADAAAALAAVRIVDGVEGDELRRRLRANVEVLAPGHPSPIIPVVVGEEQAALAAAAALLERGLLVPAIRPPTVAPGTSRLRVALSAAHTPGQVAALRDALDDLGLRP
ncbi:MAG: 8-amino-7-oxononanoate synthase [Acidimicrobiales bacterium]|nr:8-amino-7-oxononanoate synthase [Acidimicrobiales bacterium]